LKPPDYILLSVVSFFSKFITNKTADQLLSMSKIVFPLIIKGLLPEFDEVTAAQLQQQNGNHADYYCQ